MNILKTKAVIFYLVIFCATFATLGNCSRALCSVSKQIDKNIKERSGKSIRHSVKKSNKTECQTDIIYKNPFHKPDLIVKHIINHAVINFLFYSIIPVTYDRAPQIKTEYNSTDFFNYFVRPDLNN